MLYFVSVETFFCKMWAVCKYSVYIKRDLLDFLPCLTHCSFERSPTTKAWNNKGHGSYKEHFSHESKLLAAPQCLPPPLLLQVWEAFLLCSHKPWHFHKGFSVYQLHNKIDVTYVTHLLDFDRAGRRCVEALKECGLHNIWFYMNNVLEEKQTKPFLAARYIRKSFKANLIETVWPT